MIEAVEMKGPFPSGMFSFISGPTQWDWETGRLARGQWYRVIRPFIDFNGDSHPANEQWKFIGTMFSKFDDVLVLCVATSDGSEWSISLRWTPDSQEKVIKSFSEFVVSIELSPMET